ncbi:MAG: branched-chain amino acid transport system permease protein [Frankiales bacterium]|jgi:ABC-type branched-subunit amino acid transport system permease subunit|nr:branched-chain amino acid transport system permease protein [Frankiales bacterium]
MNRKTFDSPLVKRALGAFAASIVLALMIGPQEGSQDDYGLAFRESVFRPRIFVFLGIGVLGFLLVTYWARVKPYFTYPGAVAISSGVVAVVASYQLLKWDDAVGDGKLSTVGPKVVDTPALSFLARSFFGWLHWTELAVVAVLAAASIIRRSNVLAWVTAGLSLVAGIVGFVAHQQVISFTHATDHSLGAFGALFGFLAIAVASAASALDSQDSLFRESIDRALTWRPGLLLVGVGTVAATLGLTTTTWFSPQHFNTKFHATGNLFSGEAVTAMTTAYFSWLGWTLLVAAIVIAAAAVYLRNAVAAWLATAVGLLTVLLTLLTLYDISKVAAAKGVDGATGPWQNLGAGGWLACMGFSLIAAGAFAAASSLRVPAAAASLSSDRVGLSLPASGRSGRSLLLIGLILAVFLPPTMTQFWQKVLVSEIGVYVLLAVGLNVVVGWAGLLDLGYIAFYAIGSYTTAYLVGSLPHKPPDWLHMTPLLAIPFAIGICLIAGIALGAPTLRLRGDYLAIVTLGFGEIIRITAVNNPANITNSTRGPSPAVAHPSLHIGPLHWQWSQNNLQYWYLLLTLIIIVVILFYRLEGSRLGRAWAAIREDEVAAQASGVNTTRVKLMAFAIGASTSGVAGVFFASQIGYFNPDNFVLNNSILVVAYVVFGGMGSLPGAIAGAAVLTWLPEFLKDQVPPPDRQMWIGAVVLLMMIFRPAGLIPAKRRKAELHGLDGTFSSETRAVPAGEGM